MLIRTLTLVAIVACDAQSAFAAPGPVVLQTVASGLSSPVEIATAREFSGRLFVVEQGGRIRIVRNGLVLPAPFLDISPGNGGPELMNRNEEGLLGLAFHPSYATNGRFYVFYTRALAGDSDGNEIVVARYLRSAANPDLADPASGSVVITVPHPKFANHNGGKIAFGPDGYLYIGVGDGGGGGDPFNAAQSLLDLRGKILRIDVDGAQPYAIPPTNPFVAMVNPAVKHEIWAYGLRNPWRFSFDRESGDLFIGDVGQGAWEEIDFEQFGSGGGRNYGWPVFEGKNCYSPPTNCSLLGHTPPIIEYGHNASGGFSVTGGYRYQGRRFRELRGHYVYGDYVSGRIWAALPGAGGAWTATEVAGLASVSTFGEDDEGGLYAANRGSGTILRFAAPDADGDGMSDAFETQYFGTATAGNPDLDSDGDGLSNLNEYREGTNPGVKDNDIFASTRLFAMQQYRDFLSREGDAGGIAFWTGQMDTGAQPRDRMVETFFSSPEFQGAFAPVVRLYFAYFLRIPDYAGLNFWIGQARAGASLGTISDAFAASPEFQNRYGALTNGQFVNLVYQNVLGRAADAPGLAYWTAQLDSGMTRGALMIQFSESAEYAAMIGNPVYVTMMYVGMLRRSPDQGGFDFWVGYMNAGNSGLALIGGFLAAPEYRARFLP